MKRSRSDIQELLPLTHLSLLILLVLHEEPRHGYAIIQAVQARLGNGLSPVTGTFYSALKRMRREGLVEEIDPPVEAGRDDPRRRYYRPTPFGRDVLATEVRRLAALVEVARALRLVPAERS
jgi:DNA-binding PadR family transcriptional regulator